jgi:hydroxymethylbilane synthase
VARRVIGTRGSALALWQARHVAGRLRRLDASLELDERVIRTDGDLRPEAALSAAGPRGVFVRRIEDELLAGRIDLAVHSLKDLPSELPPGLCIAAVLERHDARDALVSLEGWELRDVPCGTALATGSPRRRSQLLHARPDLRCRPIRGNVDTRVGRLRAGRVPCLVLALAGVERLGIAGVIARALPTEVCLPAVGQGALAIEAREDDAPVRELVQRLDHRPTAACVRAERAFLRRLGGGCLVAATAHARVEAGDARLLVEAIVGDADGASLLAEREAGEAAGAETIGARLADRLLAAGGEAILDRARRAESSERA